MLYKTKFVRVGKTENEISQIYKLTRKNNSVYLCGQGRSDIISTDIFCMYFTSVRKPPLFFFFSHRYSVILNVTIQKKKQLAV